MQRNGMSTGGGERGVTRTVRSTRTPPSPPPHSHRGFASSPLSSPGPGGGSGGSGDGAALVPRPPPSPLNIQPHPQWGRGRDPPQPGVAGDPGARPRVVLGWGKGGRRGERGGSLFVNGGSWCGIQRGLWGNWRAPPPPQRCVWCCELGDGGVQGGPFCPHPCLQHGAWRGGSMGASQHFLQYPSVSQYIPVHPSASQYIPVYPTASQCVPVHPSTASIFHCILLHPIAFQCIPVNPSAPSTTQRLPVHLSTSQHTQ